MVQKPIEFGTLFVSFIAISISVISLNKDPQRHSDILTSENIREVYADFLEMVDLRINYPKQSHLFCTPETYFDVRNTIESSLSPLVSVSEISDLKLQERAVANRIFTQFEQVFYLEIQAEENDDKSRADFLKEVLDYYTTRLLKNPRLLWYWSNEGGNLKTQYEVKTIKYYESNIPTRFSDQDSIGPHHIKF